MDELILKYQKKLKTVSDKLNNGVNDSTLKIVRDILEEVVKDLENEKRKQQDCREAVRDIRKWITSSRL